MSQAHREGGAGLTPNSLNPYANNGELPMSDTRNNEFNRVPSPIINHRTGLPYGETPEFSGFSDHTGVRPLQSPLENPELTYIPQEGEPGGDSRSHDEIYEAALALWRLENPDGTKPTRDRFQSYINMARGGLNAPGFEYDPDAKKEVIKPIDLSEGPLDKDLVERGFIPASEARHILENYLAYNPETSPVEREHMWEEANRGVDATPVSAVLKKLKKYLEAHPQISQIDRERMEEEARKGVDMIPRDENDPNVNHRREGTNPEDQAQIEKRRSNEKQEVKIADMNQLLEEIMDYSDPKWGRDGAFSLIKVVKDEFDNPMRDAEGEVIEVVNQENFMHWIQDRAVYFHGEAPDDVMNMFTTVKLEREYKDISVQNMLDNQDKYFKDKHGNQYRDLADFVRLTLWQFTTYRTDDIEYKAMMGNDSKLNDVIAKQFYNNSRSKPGFDNMSVLANVLTMSHRFDSNASTLEQRKAGIARPEKKDIDTNLGNAINTAFLTYFNISDPEKLKSLLGDKASLLLNPDSLRSEIRKVAIEKGFGTGKDISNDQVIRFLESVESEANNSAAFLFSDEKIDDKKMEGKIIDFINIFNLPIKKSDISVIVNNLVKRAIEERYDLGHRDGDGKLESDGSGAYAQLMASFMARPMGAGWRNDLKANANDACAKPGKLEEYRHKMAGEDRAGMLGNPYTIFMIKSTLVDYLNAARSETLLEDENGDVFKDDLGNTHYYSLMQLMEKMHQQGELKIRDLGPGATEEEKKNERERAEEERRKKVIEYARKLRPTNDSQRDWAQNHMNRAFEMFHDITESNELDWSKFTDEDAWGNIRLNRGNFEKEFKDHFLKQMRYGYSTYSQLDFSRSVRYYDRSKKKWVDAPIAETLFGRQVLDIEAFWKKDYHMNDDGTFKMRKNEDGKYEKIIKKVYKGEIDPQEIQQNKKVLWKQLALARMATDIHVHRDWFSTDPRFKPKYYLMMLEAIESIQGGFDGDDTDFRSVKKNDKRAFTHDQMQWLREAAGVESGTLIRNQAIEDFFKGLGNGLLEALQGTMKNALKIS